MSATLPATPGVSTRTVTVAVPVTLHITVAVAVPEGAGISCETAAELVAASAAGHLAHVGHADIAAYNEVNRVHPQAAGTVESVSVSVGEPQRAAA